MRKYILSTLLCCALINAFAQTPQLTVNGKSNNGVVIQSLKIDVKVCGTVATTTWQMTFKNNTSKILEGNLNFPLKDGISVSRYALDISGKMREAVPVERAKGTAVFETIERRRVDPGLLEKLDGNVFRTRIYPIPANGIRTVIIGYEEELPIQQSNALSYHLPLNLQDTVSNFSVDVSVIQNAVMPIIDSAFNENIVFTKKQNTYAASFQKNNYVPNASLSFYVPKPADAVDVMLQPFENKFCFLINTSLQKNVKEKILPKTVALIWDQSLSGAARNVQKELNFLDEYFKRINNGAILFQTFNNKAGAIKNYTLQNGNWSALRKEIENLVYDGATNLSNLNFKTINADEFVLVSDGHQTIGNKNILLTNKAVYCINSSASADYSQLKFISLKTGGQLIDLQKDDLATSLNKITNEPFRFLGIKANEYLQENYPSLPIAVTQNFAVTGMFDEGLKEITLQFGYGNKVTYEKTIAINEDEQLCTDFNILKIYAQKKIAELDIKYEENKNAIESVGKQFGIITRNTSLIVLETVNDYLQYEIEPPAELRAEYQRIIKQRQGNLITKKKDELEQSLKMIDDLKNWYTQKQKKIIVKKKEAIPVTPPIRNTVANVPNATTSNRVGANKVISGKITDKDGSPVPFATIKIKGTNFGVSADANGVFTGRVRNDDALEISATGYNTAAASINNNTLVNITLERSTNELKEVVVTGAFNTRRTARSTASNTQTISGKTLEAVRQTNINDALAGKIAGIKVTSQSEAKLGASTTVRLRGENSLGVSNGALYVIDGTVMSSAANINPDDVLDVTVLQSPQATALFGSEGKDGAIVVTTKKNNGDTSYQKMQNKIDELKTKTDSISILYNPLTTDYLKIIKQTSKENRYSKYISLRSAFVAQPTFFFNVAGYFLKIGDKETGLKILSNLAELENSNYELYKMLGYKLKEIGDYEGAISAFKKVLELRPLDPQSYRDYALALQDAGQYQQALDMLYEGMTKSYSEEMQRMYAGIEEVFFTEINQLVALHKKQLNLKNVNKDLISPMATDVRVVLNWNMNNTDIDLWVTDPNGEKCSYSNRKTVQGGRMSDDFTEGFGPEQFILKTGVKGKYKIQMDYYSDSQVTIAGPTTIMAEIYLHYGTPNQERKIITLQMKEDDEGEVFIGEIVL